MAYEGLFVFLLIGVDFSCANKISVSSLVSIAFRANYGYNIGNASVFLRMADFQERLRIDMSIFDKEKTKTFSIVDEKDREIQATLSAVYEALSEKGYNPIHQIVEYILSEDPTYITNYKNARSLITRIDRYELMGALVRTYLGL